MPHEHRRELRALKVFGAWTNLVDMKAKNTLDALVTENGRTVLRHYLQDVGSTFGTGALGRATGTRATNCSTRATPCGSGSSVSASTSTVANDAVHEYPSIGRFEGDTFDPAQWKPRVPTAAFLNARADDNFWAARRSWRSPMR